MLRTQLIRMRYLGDRLLHASRRRRAVRRLAQAGPPRSILFVCYGNICRSPYAAAAFATRGLPSIGLAMRVDSAGLVGPGRPAPDAAIEVAARRGIDLRPHRSKLLSGRLAGDFDWIVVMDEVQRRVLLRTLGCAPATVLLLGDFDPERIEKRAVHDPWDQSEAVFEATYARIDRCIAEMIRAISHGTAPREVSLPLAPARA